MIVAGQAKSSVTYNGGLTIDQIFSDILRVGSSANVPENVEKLKENLLMWKNMDRLCEAMTEAGWNFIYNLIDDVFNKDGEADE